ncbi:MAG: hypothetical protein JO071_14040, partial [Deltaproteobacteria bacterium]|nr:hypothetical protein [Deltaproteobacteria bacterium]
MSAAKRLEVKVSDKTMPEPNFKAPYSGYKKSSAEAPASAGATIAPFAIAISPDDAPEWIELLPASKFSAVDGRGPFENANPDSIVAASIERMPQVGLVLDYDHSTDLAAPEGRPAPAAGWLKQFKVERGAILARIEWTAEAAEAIKAKKWRYVSPVFEHAKDGKVERILRAALTNNPALINLPAIASAQKTIDPYEASTMAREEMSLSEMAKHFPAKEGESALSHGKRLMRHLEAESSDDHAEPDGDEPSAEPGASPAESVESEEEMTARHADEMAKCSDDEMRSKCAARHAAEKDAYARRM